MMNLIDTSMGIQLRIELLADGMMLNDDSYGTEHQNNAGALMLQVKARRETLGSDPLKSYLRRALLLPQQGGFAFDICDGVWGIACDLVGDTFRQIRYDFLGSTPQGHRERTLVHDLDVPIDDFGFWLTGDLQVLLEDRKNEKAKRLHFRTFWRNEPHPSARVPFLDIYQDQCEAWDICSLLLCGDRIGILLNQAVWRGVSDLGGVMVWDWVNGRMILPYTQALDATFISRDYILRVVKAEEGLAVAVTPLKIGEAIHTLKMPTGDNLFGARFLTHTLYNSRSALGSNPPHASKGHRLPIFAPDSREEIIVLEQHYMGITHANYQLLVISTSRLIDICRTNTCGTSKRNGGSSCVGPKTVTWEWSHWGPHIARWLPCGMKRPSKRPIYGSQLLVYARVDYNKLQIESNPSVEIASEGIRRRLILLDFNSRFFSRAVNEEKERVEEQVDWLVKDVSRCSLDTPMMVSTESGLRYRAMVMQHPDKYLNAYLDGDKFLGLTEDRFDVCSFLPPARD